MDYQLTYIFFVGKIFKGKTSYKNCEKSMNEKWKPPPCNIRQHVIEKYGRENACAHDDTMVWDDCNAVCKMAANCPGCGHQRIVSTDPCAGRNMLCLNPDCGMDK